MSTSQGKTKAPSKKYKVRLNKKGILTSTCPNCAKAFDNLSRQVARNNVLRSNIKQAMEAINHGDHAKALRILNYTLSNTGRYEGQAV